MEINLKTLLEWIRKGIVFILVITVLAGACAFLYSKYMITPTYRAEVKFWADSEEAGSASLTYYKSVAPQYIELLNVNEFYEMVAEELAKDPENFFEINSAQVRGMLAFSGVVEDTSVFYARVTATDPQTAYSVAEAVAKCAPERILDLKGDDSLLVASAPVLPAAPSAPSLRSNTLYGLFAGAMLSALLVVAKEMLDNRIKTGDEISEMYGLPVLGVVPDFSNREKEGR